MKIMQLHNKYKVLGGEETVFESTNRILMEKGHSVFVWEQSSSDLQGLRGKFRAFKEGIYSFSAKKSLLSLINSQRPDIVDIHNLYPLFSSSVLSVCQKLNVPVVLRSESYRFTCPIGFHLRKGMVCDLCANGQEYQCAIKNCRGNIYESIAYALRSTVARKLGLIRNNVACYLVTSEFVKIKLVSAGYSQDRIIVVPNAVSGTRLGCDCSKGLYIAYAGRVSPEKGIETLMVSAGQTGLPLHLAGDFSAMPEVVKKAPSNVKFLGRLGRIKLAEFYGKARFLVVPSIWWEAFGLVAIEAMSHGLPVIASKIGGLAEIVEDGKTGFLIEPGNHKDLASKMTLLWNDPALCLKMGKAGRERAIHAYSENAYYERLMIVYDKAMSIKKYDNLYIAS